MDDSFFHSLLRISIAQILKAAGFDKCKPSTLNVITDIYIKHFELVLNSAKKFGQARTGCTNLLEAPDLVQALLDAQVIKPSTGESILDPKDAPEDPELEYNTKSLESFVRWLQFSDQFNLSKKLSDVPNSQLRNLMEKRKIDTSSETDQEKKKRRLRERQEYYNQLKSGENPANAQFGGMADDLEESEVTENDKLSWLAYLAEKDVKLGHNLQYANTVLQNTVLPIHKNSKYHPSKDGEDAYQIFLAHAHNNLKSDHVLLSAQGPEAENDAEDSTAPKIEPSQKLRDALPYNIKYKEALLNDDLQQYIDYAEKYGYPVSPISAKSDEDMDIDTEKEASQVAKEVQASDETPMNEDDERNNTNNFSGESQEVGTEPTTISGGSTVIGEAKAERENEAEDEKVDEGASTPKNDDEITKKEGPEDERVESDQMDEKEGAKGGESKDPLDAVKEDPVDTTEDVVDESEIQKKDEVADDAKVAADEAKEEESADADEDNEQDKSVDAEAES